MQDLGEDLNREVLKVTVKASEFLGKSLSEIATAILEKLKDAPTVKSIQSFAKTNVSIDSVDMPKESLNDFIKQCAKMKVKVAITKDPTNPENINIFFRASQRVLIEQAISSHAYKQFGDKMQSPKESIIEKIKRAIRQSKAQSEELPKMQKQLGSR